MPYMTQGLIKRGLSWSVRYVIPRHWQAKMGKKSIVRALKTRDLDEARRQKHSVLAQIISEVEAVVFPAKSALEEARAGSP